MDSTITKDIYINKHYTRDDYMSGKIKHQQYYSQFVSKGMLDYLRATLKDKIEMSTDEYLNDIPLKVWDRMPPSLLPVRLLYKLNKGASKADKVCSYKAAARMIKSENEFRRG